jgi:hypothetical protein
MLPLVKHAIRPEWIGASASAIGIAAVLIGQARGYAVLSEYGVDIRWSVGWISCAAGFILCALIHLSHSRKTG